ncbi:MAG: glycosyltransferase family 2 protein [Candidatus Omnitrophica bacterium]|jgi:glycosyltransferase involved in cell wall biosynthesis|nr:glycosyltransferase family 2 protein [Candidatus Omnitrophota bacterium]
MLTASLSVILLSYNEAENIDEVVKAALVKIPSIAADFEIIVVDDGSNDRTFEVLGSLKDSHIKIIRHYKNKGYGASLRSGLENSGKDYVVTMDADGQFDISEISKFIPYCFSHDVITGFRIKRQDPFYRGILSNVFNLLVRTIFKIKVKDIDCGFKLFKKEFLKKLTLNSDGFIINVEIIALAQKNGAKIKEVEISHYPRLYGRQKVLNYKTVSTIASDLLALKWRLLSGKNIKSQLK